MPNATSQATSQATTPDPAPTQEPKPAPPWGADTDFNPEKAWTLIQNLRSERDQARASASEARAQVEALTTQVGALTRQQQDATQAVTDLTTRLEAETTAHAKDRLLAAAGLDPDTYAPLLTATTDDGLAAQVKALTDLRTTTTTRPDPAQNAEPLTDTRAALAAQVFGD